MNPARLAAAVVTIGFCVQASAQTPAPAISKPQRELLKTLVAAVDGAAGDPDTDAASLRTHVLRASDGSHYVAFTVSTPASWSVPQGSTAIYVRLATAHSIASQRPERSLLREWLAGNQVTQPPPIGSSQGIALGEMPVMGPTGSLERRPPQTPEMANLTLIDLERRRSREREAERDRQRHLELEGKTVNSSDTLPFEDFDFHAASARTIQRALTAGPGDYFLYLAFADPAAANGAPALHVIKKRLTLPAATTTELLVGSVILADGIRVRESGYPATEQASHPYVIGLTEILPSNDAAYADNEHLSLLFQIINAKPADNGKPNLDVMFQIVRVSNGGEQAAATLTPQNYSDANLPPEFDLRVGHPLFATVTAPLTTLKHGAYRLKILVNDKVAGHTATSDVDFTVTATAASLLRDAPPLAMPFKRESLLGNDVLAGILASLRPASPSPALQRAFDLAAAGRFVDLLVEEPVPAPEEGVRAALRGIAQLGVGDASAAVQFQRAQLLGAPLAPSRLLSGAARAFQERDADAIAAWQDALTAGAPRALVQAQLLDAYVRRGDFPRAAALIAEMKLPAGSWSRGAAAVLIATQKEREALALIDARLAASPGDVDAQWLQLHALFAQLVRDSSAPKTVRDRFVQQARAYIDGKRANAAVAEEWLTVISS